MKVHKTESLTLPSSVVAIGAFDGVHRGHQTVLRETVRNSQLEGVPSVVYTFYPPPRTYFQGVPVLTKPQEKIQQIKKLGVDHIVLAEFNENYIKRTAEDFIGELSLMNPKSIIVGDDFRFGNKRTGDVPLLKKHFPVHSIHPICCIDGKRISSTRIRELMIQGKQDQALPLLGWS